MVPKAARFLVCGKRRLDVGTPRLMGVLNLTPDSFSDGGELLRGTKPDFDAIRRRADEFCSAGASILDVGGESTRPGAGTVLPQQEFDRVLPVVEMLDREYDVVVSVDTSSPKLMLEAAGLGAGMLNDVRALQCEGAVDAARRTGLPVCLMHMQGEPRVMQDSPCYTDVVTEVREFLMSRVEECERSGIERDKLLLDPGFGFGKTLEHNVALFNGLDSLVGSGLPVLIGVSRKTMIGSMLNRPVEERLAGGLALTAIAVYKGVCIIRSHDAAATMDAIRIATALRRGVENL